MDNRGDLDLNSVQGCTDSLKEGLKQTMLNQELAFMKQVYELHRLYRIQEAMTEDLKQNGSDDYRLHGGGMNSVSVNMNNQGKCSLAGCKQSENSNLQHEWGRLPGFVQKPLNLQLPADEFISYCANDIKGEGIRRGSLQHSIGSKNFSQVERVFGLDKLKLSLGIGHDPSKNGEYRDWMGKKTYASFSNVIDLEDPEFCYPDNDASPGFASGFPAPNMYAKEKPKLESLSQSGTRDLSYGAPLSVVDIGSSSHREASCDSGFVGSSTHAGHNGKHKEFLSADFSCKNQKPTVCKGNNLDLNIVQPEDTSYSSNSMVLNLSPASFPNLSKKVCPNSIIAPLFTLTCRKANVSQCSETSEKHQKRVMDLKLAVSYGETDRGKSFKDDGGKVGFIDLDSDPEEELCRSRSNPKIESVDSSKLSNGQSCNKDVFDAVGVEIRVERDAETPVSSYSSQSQTAAEPPNHQKLSSTSESDCIIDQQSSSIKTVQSGVVSGDVNFSTSDKSLNVKSGPPDAHLGEQEQGSSGSAESKIQSIVRNKPKVDEAVQTAAELLVQISSEAQACGSIELASKEFRNEDDQPQCSIESYEAMVLKEKECGPDDLCVSSNAFVVDESEKKEIRYKLKRGTRMKDFQKDILPGLSILSRHEIREDINIMEGVIRSREYKRMSARMGDGDDWCKPTRSKRSRLTYSRRYH